MRSRRFPSLTESEIAFNRKISSLNLPDGIRIEHPPFFESPDYRLEIRFRNGEDLKKKIIDLAKNPGIGGLGDPWEVK